MRITIKLLVTASFWLSVSNCYAEKPIYTRSNTAIVFDVDDVILERTYSVPALLWKHRTEVLLSLLDFSLVRDIFYLFRKTAPVGAYLVLLEKRNSRLLELARDLATTRELRPKTVCIIQTLLNLGYHLHIGTNETMNEFTLHSERFPILRRFSTYTFADYAHFPNVIQKPDIRYFELMRTRILTHAPRTQYFIFIDDRTDNIRAACGEGFIGILFTSPNALEHELVAMNIMPPTCTFSPLLTSVVL